MKGWGILLIEVKMVSESELHTTIETQTKEDNLVIGKLLSSVRRCGPYYGIM